MGIAKNDGDFLFHMTKNEFKYLKLSIDMLISKHDSDFKQNEKEFQEIMKVEKTKVDLDEINDCFYPFPLNNEMAIELFFSQPEFDLESVSQILIESLLVKHLAFIEKLIVNMSYVIQIKENQLIPPDFNISGKFTDMLKAIEYINLLTDKTFNIKNMKNWKTILLLREIRHNLAHGIKIMQLKQGQINEMDKVMKLFYVQFIKKEDKENPDKNIVMCEIKADIEVLRIINTICTDFALDMENCYLKKYK